MKRSLLAALLAALSSGVAFAGDALRIESPWLRSAPPGAMMRAAYAELRNTGDAPLRIVEARSEAFADVELHRTVEVDGVSRMRAAGVVEIAPGDSLRLQPGGLHLMLMRPRQVLDADAAVRIELLLDDGRSVSADFPQRAAAP